MLFTCAHCCYLFSCQFLWQFPTDAHVSQIIIVSPKAESCALIFDHPKDAAQWTSEHVPRSPRCLQGSLLLERLALAIRHPKTHKLVFAGNLATLIVNQSKMQFQHTIFNVTFHIQKDRRCFFFLVDHMKCPLSLCVLHVILVRRRPCSCKTPTVPTDFFFLKNASHFEECHQDCDPSHADDEEEESDHVCHFHCRSSGRSWSGLWRI